MVPAPVQSTPVEPPKPISVDLPTLSPTTSLPVPPIVPPSEQTLAQYALDKGLPSSELGSLLYFASGRKGTNAELLEAYRRGENANTGTVPVPNPEPQPIYLQGSLDVQGLSRDDFMFIHRHPEIKWMAILSGDFGAYNRGLNDAFYNGLASFDEASYVGQLRRFQQ